MKNISTLLQNIKCTWIFKLQMKEGFFQGCGAFLKNQNLTNETEHRDSWYDERYDIE